MMQTLLFLLSMALIQEEARQFAQQEMGRGVIEAKQFDSASVTPSETQNKGVLDFLQDKGVQDNEVLINQDEYFLTRSESITAEEAKVIESGSDFVIQTCQYATGPYSTTCTRHLNVEVIYHPEEKKEVKVCAQHEYKKRFTLKRDAKKEIERLRNMLKSDGTIQTFAIDGPDGGGLFHKYSVTAHWTHKDDAQNCTHYQMQLKRVKEAYYEELEDQWSYSQEGSNMFSNPDCTVVEKTCLDATPSKRINGKEVKRTCWVEQFSFLCAFPKSLDCIFLKEKNCEQIGKRCLVEGPQGCSLWELTFRCYTKLKKQVLDYQGLFGEEASGTYEPNASFSEITTKLSIFDAMQKEMQSTTASFFAGKKMSCSKNVADKIIYDCCFAYGGLAKEMGLAKCTAEEMALAEMRENGLCHYVGAKSEKFLDAWKSRDEYLFCCFTSKLNRVLQEQARGQLNRGWGDGKHPDCSGLSIDELTRLDFSKLDLREAYTDLPSHANEKIQKKIEDFQVNIVNRINVVNDDDRKR